MIIEDPFSEASMSFEKRPPLRLHGKALHTLYRNVFERDGWRCVDCGSYQLDRAPHHILPKGRGGSDTMENLDSLCLVCHAARHGVKQIV